MLTHLRTEAVDAAAAVVDVVVDVAVDVVATVSATLLMYRMVWLTVYRRRGEIHG